ncbi:hypothetical protein MMC22_009778 [Lobaria immixta]|nr:hypothetical protein [Lobaria immixta]
MYLLAVLIAGFSFSINTLGLDNSDEPSLAKQFLPLPGSSLLNGKTLGNKPSFFNVNLDTTTSKTPDIAETFTFNPNIAPGFGANDGGLNSDSFETPAVPESFTLSSNVAKGPIANSAGESSVNNPSTAYIEPQIHKDESDQICYSHSFTGPKIRKKDRNQCSIHDLLGLPPGFQGNSGPRSPEEQKNDEVIRQDEKFQEKFDAMSSDEKMETLDSVEKGRYACKEQGAPGWTWTYPMCCFGPEEFFSVPTLGFRLVRRQEVIIMNVFNCRTFLLGRPSCADPKRLYCCASADLWDMTNAQWGFKGLGCAKMEEELAVPLVWSAPSLRV